MPQLLAIILFLNSFKIFIPQTLAIILILFSTNNFIVNACYTATFNLVLSEQRLQLRYRQIRVLGLHCQQINYNICSSTVNVSHYYHVQVNLHHTSYFHMQMLAIILELFSILYLCYYSQNYSGIIISGLVTWYLRSSCCSETHVRPRFLPVFLPHSTLDVTHVRKCTRPSPLYRTASDEMLGVGLGTRLPKP